VQCIAIVIVAQGELLALNLAIGVILGLISGWISGSIAAQKGRDFGGWFAFGLAMGFLTGICLGWLPIVIVSATSDLRAEQARYDRLHRDNRRLRERLQQEQMTSESFRGQTAARLDAHDQFLGVDTRSLGALPGQAQGAQFTNLLDSSASPQGEPGRRAQSETADAPETQWQYEFMGQVFGPVSQSQLIDLFRQRRLEPDTLVWTDGWTRRREARDVFFLQPYL
jgi:uncharacterized membrane protein